MVLRHVVKCAVKMHKSWSCHEGKIILKIHKLNVNSWPYQPRKIIRIGGVF